MKSRYNFRNIFHYFNLKYLIFIYIPIVLFNDFQKSSNTYSDKLAITQTLFAPSLISIVLCIIILENTNENKITKFLSSSYWNLITDLMRISYVFHPIIFILINNYLDRPYTIVYSIFHLFVTFSIHFFYCYLYKIYIDDKIFEFTERLSKLMFP